MQNYQSLLIEEFKSRSERNRSYSKRAFARDLGLSPGHLSEVIANKKKLSSDMASKVAARVGWTTGKKQLFLKLVRLNLARTEEHRSDIQAELQDKNKPKLYKSLQQQTFQVIANWYYHAVLALTELKDFRYDVDWISSRLKLPKEKVSAAIEVLKHFQLVREEAGILKGQFEMIRADSIPSRAIREHHKQFLEKAVLALETQRFEERDITGSTLAIDPKKLPQAKKLIKEFRESIAELLSQEGENTQVYRLSVQLFRVDSDEGVKK